VQELQTSTTMPSYCLFSWWLPFWLRWDGISVLFWFAFPQLLKMLKIFSCIYWLFVLLLRTVQFFCIIWLAYLFFWCLIFWVLYKIWILIPPQMNSGQEFSPIL
jgi:hypothetical protein